MNDNLFSITELDNIIDAQKINKTPGPMDIEQNL